MLFLSSGWYDVVCSFKRRLIEIWISKDPFQKLVSFRRAIRLLGFTSNHIPRGLYKCSEGVSKGQMIE